jgi:hypothetical protein
MVQGFDEFVSYQVKRLSLQARWVWRGLMSFQLLDETSERLFIILFRHGFSLLLSVRCVTDVRHLATPHSGFRPIRSLFDQTKPTKPHQKPLSEWMNSSEFQRRFDSVIRWTY